jgi:Flp pilus assembly protein TadD
VRTDKKLPPKADKKTPPRVHKQGVVGYSKKSALLEEAISNMNTGKYGRSSTVLKELLALDPQNVEARRLFATLQLRLGSLVAARQAFESLATDAIERQDFWTPVCPIPRTVGQSV